MTDSLNPLTRNRQALIQLCREQMQLESSKGPNSGSIQLVLVDIRGNKCRVRDSKSIPEDDEFLDMKVSLRDVLTGPNLFTDSSASVQQAEALQKGRRIAGLSAYGGSKEQRDEIYAAWIAEYRDMKRGNPERTEWSIAQAIARKEQFQNANTGKPFTPELINRVIKHAEQ